jgi:formamidopyrimidine-DNA glycosylase
MFCRYKCVYRYNAISFSECHPMPELPEVEMMRRGLLSVVGRTIARVEVPRTAYRPIQIFPSPRSLAARCQGRNIVDIQRIAKRVLVRLCSDDRIVLQPKMAGIVLIADPPSAGHTRVVFYLQGKKTPNQFQYWDRRGLGTVSLWSPEEISRQLADDVLGPDALTIDKTTFTNRLCTSRREVKVALLDQQIVAGIGNIYAAEILFAAKIDPQRRCNELSKRQCGNIHREMIRILAEAIQYEGSTLSDGTYRNAINGEGSYQNHHLVYDREGKPCVRCGCSIVKRIVQAQRSTFYCPRCQTQN